MPNDRPEGEQGDDAKGEDAAAIAKDARMHFLLWSECDEVL